MLLLVGLGAQVYGGLCVTRLCHSLGLGIGHYLVTTSKLFLASPFIAGLGSRSLSRPESALFCYSWSRSFENLRSRSRKFSFDSPVLLCSVIARE